MLHRLALRVLPSLTLAVTEDSVRKRKRLVMFVPGLVAFAVTGGQTGIFIGGAYDLVAPEWADLDGDGSLRLSCWTRIAVRRLVGADGARRIGWVLAWIGFVYGIQLSLLVLPCCGWSDMTMPSILMDRP